MDGSLVASDVRRETGGDRYPSSPLEGRRSSLDAGLLAKSSGSLPDEMLYDVPKTELLVDAVDATE